MMLTTKFVPEMIAVARGSEDIMKPKSIMEFNKHKSYIDISDQMKSYNSSLRRGVKWYRKLAIELVVDAGRSMLIVFINKLLTIKCQSPNLKKKILKDLTIIS